MKIIFIERLIKGNHALKKLGEYVTAFDYILFIISSAIVVGAPVGIASASFTLIFSLTTRIIKNLLSIIRSKKKKHDKTLFAKSKLNSIRL